MDCKDGKGVLRVDGSRTCGVNWALSDAKRRDDRNRRKRLLNPPTYVKGHEKDANGIVVGKWLYYCAILGKELNTREAALKHNTITLSLSIMMGTLNPNSFILAATASTAGTSGS